MAEIIARFADGRLLVQEEKAMEERYVSGGVPFRIGLVKTVEKVISIDTSISGYLGENVAAPLNEVLISGDTIIPILRRSDMPMASGYPMSGLTAIFALSGTTSGLDFGEQLASGSLSSGLITILANVIGY